MAQITANLIGVRVSWRVNEFLGERETLVSIAKQCGLDGDLMPNNTIKKAVGRASHAIAKANNGRFMEALPPRKLTDNKEKAVYAIVSEKVDQDTEHADYAQETTIRMDKEDKTVVAVGAQAGEFMAKYEQYKDAMTDHDIRAFCLLMVRHSLGIAYNPSGHDYFVPEAHQENMDKLDTFLRTLKVGRMYITPAIDDANSLEVTWERASEVLLKEVGTILKNIEKFGKRVSGLREKNETLKGLGEMAKVYGNLTKRAVEAEEMLNTINAASDKVAAKIEEANNRLTEAE
jgi:hypothetical protein